MPNTTPKARAGELANELLCAFMAMPAILAFLYVVWVTFCMPMGVRH